MKKISSYLVAAIIVLVLAALSWLYFGNYLEREKPLIKLNQDIIAIGKQKKIDITFTDQQSGIAHFQIEIIQDNKGKILASQDISARGEKQKSFSLIIEPTVLKLHDGIATINFVATDHSLFKNEATLSQSVKIDTIPPQIDLLTTINIINKGGTGFIAYRTSKPLELTGVYVDDYFSRGYTSLIDNKPVSMTYFALPIDASKTKTKITVFARDDAGNEARMPLPWTIKDKKFRADKMNLSESFLQQKMPEFQATTTSLQGKTPLEVFTYINEQMRIDNFRTIQTYCQKSVPKRLWEGTFIRMRNASPMALFGDRRTYLVGGKAVAESLHVGVDLASVAHAPIEAANNGVVVFAAPLGIYGNAVLIDHGLGLFTLYGHLSSFSTEVGKTVKKEEVIGHSGTSGLAGGDHMHFSVLVGGQFVNPQEWWDPHWIQDNITKKMF
jgi:murein DD-endopeptidase MepM/ murein hydrolase activator NlpD